MELTPSKPILAQQPDTEMEVETNSNRKLSAVEDREMDEEGQLVEKLCQSVDAVIAKTESIILEVQTGRKSKATSVISQGQLFLHAAPRQYFYLWHRFPIPKPPVDSHQISLEAIWMLRILDQFSLVHLAGCEQQVISR